MDQADTAGVQDNSVECCDDKNDARGYKNLSVEIENYLRSLNDESSHEAINPKLKAEKRRLRDLLESYKKLCQRLDQKCEAAAAQGVSIPPVKEVVARLPEIYAILHPDLYRDVRDEEKKRLAETFSRKRIFSASQKVIPPNPAASVRQLSDLRQKEKDRFCRLIASAPSRFHNVLEPSSLAKKRILRKTQPIVRVKEDVRESEKERLARIFATSSVFLRNPVVQKKIVDRLNGIEDAGKRLEAKEKPLCDFRPFDSCQNQGNSASSVKTAAARSKEAKPVPFRSAKGMVRMGEYSPLNKKNISKGRTELGVGEHEETKDYLDRERKQEYQTFITRERQREKVDKSVMVKLSDDRPVTSMSTVSTQTDDSFQESRGRSLSQPQSPDYNPKFDENYEISPREKLISDLYGAPSHLRNFRPTTYEELIQEEKRKQIAYAEALKRQIQEKNRIEEEKRRKEKEEEDFYERKFQEQAERLQVQYANERIQKHDTEIQRQAQEEFMRKKLKELSLEAEELKQKEKLQKVQVGERAESRAHSRMSQASSRGRQVLSAKVNDKMKPLQRQVRPNDLPEQLPPTNWEMDADRYFTNLEGVDLLREYRNSKERLQLPPRVSQTDKFETERPPTAGSQHNDVGYIPSVEMALSRKPRIETAKIPDSISQSQPLRSPSPVLPAVRTEMLVKRNSKIFDDKKRISNVALDRSPSKPTTPENVLTQLGAFRRQLAREHYRLEQQFKGQSS